MGVEEFWDARYRVNDDSSVAEDGPALSAALAHFGEVAGKRVLDLGCGMGHSSLFFAQRGAQVMAVDVSRVAVERLRSLCAERGIDNVQAVQCSAFDIAELGPVDCVFGAMILHHLEPFDEFALVLRATLEHPELLFFRLVSDYLLRGHLQAPFAWADRVG